MTPAQKIKELILEEANRLIVKDDFPPVEFTAVDIDDIYEQMVGEDGFDLFISSDYLSDAGETIRESGSESGLKTKESRSSSSYYYNCTEKALQVKDGSWVGYTFWDYDPNIQELPWVEDAYDLDMVEEMRPVRVFHRKDGS